MTLSRREVLQAGLAVAGAAAAGTLSTVALGSPAAAASTGLSPAGYVLPRAPLQPAAFLRLPPGSVRASGWLATQLDHEVNGLCGRYPEVSHFLDYDTSGWINPARTGGEEVAYWLRGYVPLGHVTGDSTVRATSDKWVAGVLATASADGFFGPAALRAAQDGHLDPWPVMPMLHALRSAYEFSGDGAILTLLTNYFAYLLRQPAAVFSSGWGTTRWGDTIDVVHWLYNRTGESFLLDLVTKIHADSADWVNGVPSLHNVNIAQGFREPAQYWVSSGNAAHRAATYARYADVQGAYGQFPGGGFGGDEIARPGYGDPRQGFETCGIVEYMASHEILHRLTGDGVWADRIEELAFNSLPAALDPLGRSCHYITSANSIDLDNTAKTFGQFTNNWAMQAYMAGVDNYRCCPHNYGMGWPYLVEEMWLATPDGGLCAAVYGPSSVTAKVTGGVAVTITEATSYPFSDTVTLTVSPATPTAFPLMLRIPGWCSSPTVTLNGVVVSSNPGPAYARINRTWTAGDVVTVRMPMSPVRRTWSTQHNAASVNYGPLTFSLAIAESWVRTAGDAQWPQWAVHASSPWNYGLVPGAAVTVATGGNTGDPFTPANAPVRLTTSAQRITGWQADAQQVVSPLQTGPFAADGPVEQVSLIPMGAARLRITSFPQTGGTAQWSEGRGAFRIRNRNSGKVLGVDGMSTADSAPVVQFSDSGTADHLWWLVDDGAGGIKFQNVNSGKLLGVDQMSTADSAGIVQYADSGTPDHRWRFLDNGSGWLRIANLNSGKVLGVDQMSTADSARIVQFADSGTADHDWQLIPDGPVKIVNRNSNKLLGVDQMSTADSARVVQFADTGTADHLWVFVPNADGSLRVSNVNSGKVLGVDQMSTADSAVVVQFSDTGTPDHDWRLRAAPGAGPVFRLQNVNSGKVLGVDLMSVLDSAQVVQFGDGGTADHDWQLVAPDGTPRWPVARAAFRIRNRNSGKVLGVDAMAMADSAQVVQFSDSGTVDHLWWLVDDGSGNIKIQNVNSGKVLGVDQMSTADSARIVQYADSGTPDHQWRLLDNGSGWLRIANPNSGKVLGVDQMSAADSAPIVQFADSGTTDHDWQLIPDNPVKIRNRNSGKLLAVAGMSKADSARVVQFSDNGTPDHLWVANPNTDGTLRLVNINSGKALGIDQMSTADSAPAVQFTDSGTADHDWCLRAAPGAGTVFRLQNRNSGKVLGVDQMSTVDSAPVVQYSDTGTADHDWQVVL